MTDEDIRFSDGTGQLGKIEKKEQTLVLSSPTKHVGRWIVDRSLGLAGLDPYRDYSVRGTDIRSAADYILQLEAKEFEEIKPILDLVQELRAARKAYELVADKSPLRTEEEQDVFQKIEYALDQLRDKLELGE